MAPANEVSGTLMSVPNWNTRNLPYRLSSDIFAAAAAGAVVAPIITMIDRAIIENASGRSTLPSSLISSARTLLTRPHRFLTSRPFLLIFALYTGTYLSANLVDTVSSTLHSNPASTVTAGTAKFLVTSAANMSLCLYKDSQFTRMFGAVAAAGGKSKVPPATYALFAARDSMTVFASFNLPPLLAPYLPATRVLGRQVDSLTLAQFLAPAGCQVFSTPLHLLGLDLYNRPSGGKGAERVTWGSRAHRVGRDWAVSCGARICRILPAFGVGGVVNSGVRRWGMLELE